jgi:hypothetical protein
LCTTAKFGVDWPVWVLVVDSRGNVYSAEVQGKRVQKFRNLGGL